MLLDELRGYRIILPPMPVVERLWGEVQARAHRQLWRRLTDGLTAVQRDALDGLLTVRSGGGQSTLAWLRQTAFSPTPGNFPRLIERLLDTHRPRARDGCHAHRRGTQHVRGFARLRVQEDRTCPWGSRTFCAQSPGFSSAPRQISPQLIDSSNL